MHHMPYTPFSSDLAPSNFSLFLTVEEKLEEIQVVDKDQLFEGFQEFLGISITTN
jgi:hypothetical protein